MRIKSKKLYVCLMMLLLVLCTSTTAFAAKAKLNKKKATLYIGEKLTLKVNNTKKKVTFKSSDKTVAKVKKKKGVVTAVGEGKAVITATFGKKTLKCKITVKEEPSLTLNRGTLSMTVGDVKTLKAEAVGLKGTIVWSSYDENVCTVSQTGRVTAVHEGIGVIVASLGDYVAACQVSVAPGESSDISKKARAAYKAMLAAPTNYHWMEGYNNTANFEFYLLDMNDDGIEELFIRNLVGERFNGGYNAVFTYTGGVVRRMLQGDTGITGDYYTIYPETKKLRVVMASQGIGEAYYCEMNKYGYWTAFATCKGTTTNYGNVVYRGPLPGAPASAGGAYSYMYFTDYFTQSERALINAYCNDAKAADAWIRNTSVNREIYLS